MSSASETNPMYTLATIAPTTSNSIRAAASTTVTCDANGSSTASVNATLTFQSNIIQELSALKLFQDFDVEGLTLEQRLRLELEIVAEAREKLSRVQEMLDLTWKHFCMSYGEYNEQQYEEGEEEEEEEEGEEEDGAEVFLEDVVALGWFD